MSLPTYSAGMRFDGLWPAGSHKLTSGADKNVTVTVPALSARVWKAKSPLARRTTAPAIGFESPLPGATVGGRAEIVVSAAEDAFSQVSFAYRKHGASAWTYLGTDDNAPYRLFHDVRGLARGTLLEYRAVLKDSSGNLSVANTTGLVGDPAPPADPVPTTVTVPGSFNSEMGCAGDWMPDCAKAHLAKDSGDGLWKGTFTIPVGSYDYKVAINDSWDVNYGIGGERNGGNITYIANSAREVTFVYDQGTHLITATPPSD